MADTIAIIGAGLIGRAWAIAFGRGGCNVRLFDPVEGVAVGAIELIRETVTEMSGHGLLNGQSPAVITARLSATASIADAVSGVVHVQENSPERPDVKTALFRELDKLVPASAVIASSTSAILPSVFTAHISTRDRCLVAHPLNPPHLIPAVEVVPAPWTSPETVARTRDLMRSIGQTPIIMKREIEGFLMNRLQGAILEECFRLVASGLVDPEDCDIGLRDGLALRWSFMGPFETSDLNAPGGIADYARRYEPGFAKQFESQKSRVAWSGEVLDKIQDYRRARVPLDAIADRQIWRDKRLMALAAHKKKAAAEIGE